ncbi:flagellar basal body-associated protein FliL [Trueperella pyogenes]|nr:flagellar basal body-associated protein FliL [Trueperella pyogenes]
MSLTKRRWLPILVAIFIICLVIGIVFLAFYSQQATPVQDSPTSTQAPVEQSDYWNKERMESATPAPMPSP